MKLKFIDPHNLAHLIPVWVCNPFDLAKSLDDLFARCFEQKPRLRPQRWDKSLRFWVEVTGDQDVLSAHLRVPNAPGDKFLCGQLIIDTEDRQVTVPLNACLKGSDPLSGMHSVYIHSILTDVPLPYVGITKQRWYERYAQHRSAAEHGSNLVFHRALRDHNGTRMAHRVLLTGVDFGNAMRLEEEWVGILSLYPLGLNMIPGGYAGLKYLHKLGVFAKSAEERDRALEEISEQPTLGGNPNPLCAARWAADRDYVNRVVCGHSGRLSVDQVRRIRMLLGTGRSRAEVASMVGDSEQRVADVDSGKTYARVS